MQLNYMSNAIHSYFDAFEMNLENCNFDERNIMAVKSRVSHRKSYEKHNNSIYVSTCRETFCGGGVPFSARSANYFTIYVYACSRVPSSLNAPRAHVLYLFTYASNSTHNFTAHEHMCLSCSVYAHGNDESVLS